MPHVIPSVPLCFDLAPFGGRWFSWAEIANCFWPPKGRRAKDINPDLAPLQKKGGVYLIAWSPQPPPRIHPLEAAIHYIGETGHFRKRMGGFGISAGFWGKRGYGHSAAWRWPEGKSEHMWIAFFVVGEQLLPHLAAGLRKWLEAVALEEHRMEHGRLPAINAREPVVWDNVPTVPPTSSESRL